LLQAKILLAFPPVTKKDFNGGSLRVGLISLGCAKNLVDAEIMLGALLQDGVEITNDASRADAVIVNTCSFIDAAQEESVDAILESAVLREANHRGQAIIVSGCMPQRFRDELPKLLPEVDAFMGIDQVAQVSEIVKQAMARRATRLVESRELRVEGRKLKTMKRLAELDQNPAALEHDPGGDGSPSRPRTPRRGVPTFPSLILDVRPFTPLVNVNPRPIFIPDFATPRFRLTPRHFAYVKIAEGCNHPCSFCIIPRMRGSHRSRQQADIVAEAKALIANGVKEINLISQDSTYYGLDLRPNPSRAVSSPEKFSVAVRSLAADATTICTLLRELNALKGDFWIRLLYTHPAHWMDELIRTIAECPKVTRYVDIPLQHIHENMLERMRRETSRQYIVELIKKIRAGISGIALRTTLIVGFPGETEACFEELLDFIRETKFERLGVFAYSREAGTRAGVMTGQIPDKVKQQRRKRAMAEQHKITRQISKSFVGREIKVLVEGRASKRQLQDADVSSWEHGLLREKETLNSQISTLNYLTARSEADAPDIDGRVYVQGRVPIGEFARVKIVGYADYDLFAEPV
jgi:ribosomal protein S12 methylthiotransferase